jgi:hypothetical protein
MRDTELQSSSTHTPWLIPSLRLKRSTSDQALIDTVAVGGSPTKRIVADSVSNCDLDHGWGRVGGHPFLAATRVLKLPRISHKSL